MMPIDNSTRPPFTGVSPDAGISFTAEELKVMRECNQEGLIKRGIPCAAVFGCGAFYALKNGFLKPHAIYGSVPAVALAGLIGCLTGKFSYKYECLKKVLALPNSSLRQQIESRLQQQKPVTVGPVQFIPEKMDLGTDDTQMISGTQMESYQSTSSFDGFSGVDIDSDQPAKFNPVAPLGKLDDRSQTYDDLRRRNREEYVRSTYSRLPQESSSAQLNRSQTRPSEESQGFDRDRVPQYQLVD